VLQVFSGLAAFDAAQRMARALCSSTLVPKEYQGQQGLANSLIALEIAGRMRLSPLVVMQNMTPIHGRPTWSSKFLIATVNASGRFSPLRFVFDNPDAPTRCHAVATDKATAEVLEGETITLELARKEGWWSRKDRQGNETSKWQTMTGQMLRYRAAAWWANVYCPEIALGLITQEEALDIEPVRAVPVEPAEARRGIAGAAIPTAPATPAAEPWLEAGEKAMELPRAKGLEQDPQASQPHAGPAIQTPGPIAAPIHESVRETTLSTLQTPKIAAGGAEHPAHFAGGDSAAQVQTPSSPSPAAVPALSTKQAATRTKPAPRSSLASASTPASQPAKLQQQAESPPASTAVVASEPVAASPKAEPLLTDPQQEAIPVGAPPALPTPLAPNLFEAGLLQIPRIASLQELESAAQRISQLVSDREVNPGQGQTLFAALSRRRAHLEEQCPDRGALAP
jgi:hypothetical protein